MEIIYENILFIISVSCQIVGSIALAIHVFPFRRKTIVQSFFRNSFSSQDGENIEYDHQLFVKHIRKAYLTWLSVIVLLMGYILQLFCSKNDDNHLILLAGILFFSILIYAIIFFLSSLIARWIGKKRVTNKELEDYQITTNISFMQEEEVIQILEEKFGKVFNDEL